MSTNSDYFDLSNWKLTLPVDSSGGITGTAVEITSLQGYESQYFFDAPDHAMVFKAFADGATTSGSSYPRSELREMNGTDKAAWTLSQGGTMSATLKIDQMPNYSDGRPGRAVIGQIHGSSDELIRLYYEGGKIYFKNDQAGSNNTEQAFYFKNAQGQEPNVSLGEKFSYIISAKNDTLTVKIFADGQTYVSETKINSVWQSDHFYFKAGIYLGINENNGYGEGQVSFYGLDFGHQTGEGYDAWNAATGGASTPPPPPPPSPTPTDSIALYGDSGANTLTGGSGNEELKGYGGNDLLKAGAGNDMLWGNDANDTLVGGLGTDTLKGGPGDDTFVFQDISEGSDTILDYVQSQDKIDLSGIPLGATTLADALASGALRLTQAGTSVELWVKVAGVEKLLATLLDTQTSELAAANFILPKEVAPPPPPPPSDEPTTISGDANANVLLGGSGNEVLKGYAGNDMLNAGAGNDYLWGNDGNDTLIGGLGVDSLKGGPGNDTFVFQDANGSGDTIVDYVQSQDKIDLSGLALGATSFANAIASGVLHLTQVGSNVELWAKIAGVDKLVATLLDTQTSEVGSANFILPKEVVSPTLPPPSPTDSSVTLTGTSGADTLNGGSGNDTILGKGSSDIIYGGGGADTLTGGGGNDRFVYKNVNDAGDSITDFRTGDTLNIKQLASTFSGAPTSISQMIAQGYLSFEQVNDTTHHVFVDVDGSAGAASHVLLVTLHTESWYDADSSMFSLS